MPKPKITVLMTNYNGGRYIKSTVESVLRQNLSDFEFLIIDDGSSDDSLSILQSFNDARIKINRNPSNIGQTRSLNVGLRLAQGSYVARIDADDLAFPHWLKEQFTFLESNPRIAVVSTPAIIIDQNNQIKKVLNSFYRPEDLAVKILTATPINHVGSMIRKDVVIQVGGFKENLRVAADFELWSELTRRQIPITSTKKILVAIRVHHESVSSQEKQKTTFYEVAGIIQRNFSSLLGRPISDEEALMIVKVDYLPEGLTSEDIEKISDLLMSACEKIKSQAHLQASLVQARINHIIRAIYVKKIFECIQRDLIQDARLIIKNYHKRQGPAGLAFVLLLLTWGGRALLRCVPRGYEFLINISAKAKMKGMSEHMLLQFPSLPSHPYV